MLSILNAALYYPLVNLLIFFIWLVPGHNAIWGIILLTLAVRFILILPSKRAAQSQRKMNEMQPLLEELKVEYGDDKQGLAAAQMDLYKKNNISPFASCLPILIQLPVLIFLYQAILHGLTPNFPGLYSFTPRPEHINLFFLGADLLKPDRTYILPVIAAVLQYFQVKLTMPPAPKLAPGQQADPAAAMQKNMMYISPVLTLLIAYRFPAGAAVYWIVTTAFSIVQQRSVNRQNLKLSGVSDSIEAAERIHPEHKGEGAKVLKELKPLEEKSKKGGVSVTVRRKG